MNILPSNVGERSGMGLGTVGCVLNAARLVLLGAIGALCVACASGGPIPADKLSRSQAAIRSAQEMGAERNPTASEYLKTARDELKRGRKLVISGDEDLAATMLLRAEADAELAMNVTRESAAVADAQKTRDDIRTLRVSMSTMKDSY